MNPTTEQQVWLNDQMAKATTPERVNPCVGIFGSGPAGRVCRECVHLYRKVMGKTYLKCALRRNTGGPATDHRARWAACAKFEEEKK